MKRTLGLLGLLATLSVGGACDSNSNAPANGNSGQRNGVVETNANVSPNMNGDTAPSNTAVITNNNGNKNTSTVDKSNTNAPNTNKNKNANNKNGNGNK
ncbi:MAG: hypothetical protein ABIP75_01780 [Pyrinomonadaceae bacterium]